MLAASVVVPLTTAWTETLSLTFTVPIPSRPALTRVLVVTEYVFLNWSELFTVMEEELTAVT
jgi:hypothetical protein